MNSEKLEELISQKDYSGKNEEFQQYSQLQLYLLCRLLWDTLDLSINGDENDETTDMRDLTSIFDSVSTMFSNYKEREDQLNQNIKIAASTLHSQNETIISLFNDLLASMKYPLCIYDE